MATSQTLVFGAGGWLGAALVPLLDADACTPRSSEIDVTSERDVRGLVERVRPRVVFNLAACGPGQGPAERMRLVNGHAAGVVARAAVRVGARLVHVSSDVVHDGLHAPYDDDACPAPVNEYGRSKADGEWAVHAAGADAVIVRTSLIFDPVAIDGSTRGFAERLARGEPCRLFTDELRCPIARRTLASALVELAASAYTGPLNVSGTSALSRHEFGLLLLRRFDCPGIERVEAARASELGVPRPPDLTLDVSRARALLRTPLRSVQEELDAADAAAA